MYPVLAHGHGHAICHRGRVSPQCVQVLLSFSKIERIQRNEDEILYWQAIDFNRRTAGGGFRSFPAALHWPASDLCWRRPRRGPLHQASPHHRQERLAVRSMSRVCGWIIPGGVRLKSCRAGRKCAVTSTGLKKLCRSRGSQCWTLRTRIPHAGTSQSAELKCLVTLLSRSPPHSGIYGVADRFTIPNREKSSMPRSS